MKGGMRTMIASRHQAGYVLTQHAVRQMHARRISAQAVALAMTYGRAAWTRGARIFAIGRREVQRYRTYGIDLAPFEGVHVVTSPEGAIITVYRNRDLRDLRRGDQPRRHGRSLRRVLLQAGLLALPDALAEAPGQMAGSSPR